MGRCFFTNIAASAHLLEFTAAHTAYLQPLVYHQTVKVRTRVDGSLRSRLFDDHALLISAGTGFALMMRGCLGKADPTRSALIQNAEATLPGMS